MKASICLFICIIALVFVGCNPFAGDQEYKVQDATLKDSIEHIKAINECLENNISLENENKEYYELIKQIIAENNESLSTFYFVNLTINVNDGLIELENIQNENGTYILQGVDSGSIIEFSRSEFRYKILDRTEEGVEKTTSIFDFNQDKNSYKCLLTIDGELKTLFECVEKGNEYYVQIYSCETKQLLKLHFEYRVEKLRWLRAEAIDNTSEPISIFDNGIEGFISEHAGVYISK